MAIDTPVAYIVFNRPRHTEKTFAVLREQKPSKLFIIADGPRSAHPEDKERCAEVRAIVEQVDWPCEVHHNYADSNLGLKERVSTGLTWVFENADRAIVLEDDCVAHPDFFMFCSDLLDRYEEDDRVSVITGNNFQNGHWRGDGSYYFSKYNHCWGWATWRREWLKYDGSIAFWDKWKVSEDWVQKTPDRVERRYWGRVFDGVRAGKFDSWAYPWTASLWYRGGLTATPNVNLVSNIGFGKESTHTGSRSSPVAELPTSEIGNLSHPSNVAQDLVADQHVFEFNFGGRNQRFPKNLIVFPRRLARWCFLRLKWSISIVRGVHEIFVK